MKNRINCPHCQSSIEITEVMSAQLSAQIRAEIESEVATKRKKVAELEHDLTVRETELSVRATEIEQEIAHRMKDERSRVLAEAKELAEQDLRQELQNQDAEMDVLRNRLKESQKAELELQTKQRELQDRAEVLELEVARKLNEERSGIRQKALQDADEQHRLNLAEKESQIQGLLKKIDELKRKAEQGSQQIQGEVLELALEEALQQSFPADRITPVSKGTTGGDVFQDVRNGSGRECGLILWESKRAKNWSKAWLAKARDDQRSARAACVVIVSEALPDDVQTFSFIDGVWVCSWSCAVGLATALRFGLIEIGNCRLAAEGQHDKMQLVYNYLSGPEFQQRVDGVVEAFVSLQSDLELEKRSMQRIWSKREKQIQRAFANTAGMYGDLQGIIGSSLPTIEGLVAPRIESYEHQSSGVEVPHQTTA